MGLRPKDQCDYLIEIKTSESPRLCIREAIGQLLEYAFYGESFSNPELIIIGPQKQSLEDLSYIDKLNSILDVKIRYCHYKIGTNEFLYTF